LSQGLGDTNTAPRFALYVAVFVSPSPWLFGYGVLITSRNAAIRQKNRRIEDVLPVNDKKLYTNAERTPFSTALRELR